MQFNSHKCPSEKLQGTTFALSIKYQLSHLFILKKTVKFCVLFCGWKYSGLGFSFLGSKVTGKRHTIKHTYKVFQRSFTIKEARSDKWQHTFMKEASDRSRNCLFHFPFILMKNVRPDSCSRKSAFDLKTTTVLHYGSSKS